MSRSLALTSPGGSRIHAIFSLRRETIRGLFSGAISVLHQALWWILERIALPPPAADARKRIKEEESGSKPLEVKGTFRSRRRTQDDWNRLLLVANWLLIVEV